MRSVYVIAERDAVRSKIGVASDPKKRLGLLQTGQSRRLVLHGAWLVERAEEVERAAHEVLAATRQCGEWFGVEAAEAAFCVGLVCGRLGLTPKTIDLEVAVIPINAGALQRWRMENGHTQSSLGSLLGVNSTALSRIERGERRPRRDLESRIIALTGLTRDQLAEVSTAEEAA